MSDVTFTKRGKLSAAVVALVAVLGIAGYALVGNGGSDAHSAPTRAVRPVATTTTTAAGQTFRAATTKPGGIPVYAAPDNQSAPTTTLSPQTEYLVPRTVLAFGQQGDWLHVFLPTRPNASTAWVKATDVTVSAPLERTVKVSLAEHKVWVLRNGTVELTADAAIGTPDNPTPTGTFYITDPVDLRSDPNTAYGVYALGLSGHSDTLSEFNGGDAQIAIHGTNEPGAIGKNVSHGCVRVQNDVILKLAALPLGTPVFIS